MRRVVADQIKALNELSALVSRSNRMVDAAPAAQPRKAAVNETPVAATMAAVAAAVEQQHRADSVRLPLPRWSPARPNPSPRLLRPRARPGSCACSPGPARRRAPGSPAGRKRPPARPALVAAGCRIF